MNNQEYMQVKFDKLKTYKKPTDEQLKFMELFNLSERTKEQEKLLLALTKKFKANDDYLKSKKLVNNIVNAENRIANEQARKDHAHKMIVAGGLFLSDIEKDDYLKQKLQSYMDSGKIKEKDRSLFVEYLNSNPIRESFIHIE